jgi:hypothetical protein
MNMRINIIMSILLSLTFPALSQLTAETETGRGQLTELPIQGRLFELSEAATSNPAQYKHMLDLHKIHQRPDGKVQVRVLHNLNHHPVTAQILDRHQAEVFLTTAWETSIYIHPSKLVGLASDLPEGYKIVQEVPAWEMNQGPNADVHNSAGYVSSGPGGSGKKIAIIDVGFNGLIAAVDAGRAPADYDTTDYSGSGVLNGSSHGVAVTETVFDHAPNAEYYLYKVINASQCASAVNDAHTTGVDVINMSLGYSGLSWTDDDNSLCQACNDAANDGILVFVSAGNNKQMHWQGMFSDNDNDNWHGWSGNNELNSITLPDSTTLSVTLMWDVQDFTDYDGFIYTNNGTTILDSDPETGTTFEFLSWQNTTGLSVPVQVAVRKISGPAAEFEILCRTDGVGSSVVNDQLAFRTSASSITWPASCGADNVIGVPGVIWSDFDEPNGTAGIDEVYSSEGPTNDGDRGVDLTGATRTGIGAGGGQFFGTSCASPNAAGAATALWSAQPLLSADAMRYLLQRKAEVFNDWGAAGPDNIYGFGGVYLYDYFDNSKYVDKTVNNGAGSVSQIFQYVNHAVNAIPPVPEEGMIIFLEGGNYPSPFTPLNYLIENREIDFRTIDGQIMLGGNQ